MHGEQYQTHQPHLDPVLQQHHGILPPVLKIHYKSSVGSAGGQAQGLPGTKQTLYHWIDLIPVASFLRPSTNELIRWGSFYSPVISSYAHADSLKKILILTNEKLSWVLRVIATVTMTNTNYTSVFEYGPQGLFLLQLQAGKVIRISEFHEPSIVHISFPTNPNPTFSQNGISQAGRLKQM